MLIIRFTEELFPIDVFTSPGEAIVDVLHTANSRDVATRLDTEAPVTFWNFSFLLVRPSTMSRHFEYEEGFKVFRKLLVSVKFVFIWMSINSYCRQQYNNNHHNLTNRFHFFALFNIKIHIFINYQF